MRRLWMQVRLMRSLKVVALTAFCGYVAWNAVWLFRGHIPPSIFSYFTGLPCPTSGMTRGILSLFHGNVRDFLLYNPLTLVYLSLLAVSAVIIFSRLVKKREIVLPGFMAWAWLLALVFGWFAKFAVGSGYW